MFNHRNSLFSKYADKLLRIMKNTSLVLKKQPTEIPAREDEELLELSWYWISLFYFVQGSLSET